MSGYIVLLSHESGEHSKVNLVDVTKREAIEIAQGKARKPVWFRHTVTVCAKVPGYWWYERVRPVYACWVDEQGFQHQVPPFRGAWPECATKDV